MILREPHKVASSSMDTIVTFKNKKYPLYEAKPNPDWQQQLRLFKFSFN